MIDADLLEKLDAEMRIAVLESFAVIMDSGIIDLQQERLLARLRAGALDEDDVKLAARIKAYRGDIAKLQALKSLGDLIKQKDEYR